MREVFLVIGLFVVGAGRLPAAIGTAPPAEPDSLWDRAVAIVGRADRSVAARIETRTDYYGGDGKRMETHQQVETLTGWNAEEPIRKTELARDVVKKSGLSVAIDLGAQDNPFAATLDGRASHARAGEDTLDGRPCVTYRFEEQPAPGNEEKIGVLVGTAWIERESAIPLQITYRPKELPKHVSMYELTVRFSGRPGESAVPRTLDMQMRAGFLWYKRVVRLHKEFHDWVTVPGTTAATDSLPEAVSAGAP